MSPITDDQLRDVTTRWRLDLLDDSPISDADFAAQLGDSISVAEVRQLLARVRGRIARKARR